MLEECHFDDVRCHQVFNEPDKGKTRRLFLFREPEKTAEKKTPGGVLFRTVVSLEPEKV